MDARCPVPPLPARPPTVAQPWTPDAQSLHFLPARPPWCSFAGILSAVGIHLADIVAEAQEPCAATLALPGKPCDAKVLAELSETLARLEEPVVEQLKVGKVESRSRWGRCRAAQ
eukprot:14677-Chlamydomonas_euryale.AAC.1